MTVLQENDEFSEHRFWFNFFYIIESAARYYEKYKRLCRLPLQSSSIELRHSSMKNHTLYLIRSL